MPLPVCHGSIPYSEHVLNMRVASAFGVNLARVIPKPSSASAFGESSDPITRFCPWNGNREGRTTDFRKGHIVTPSSTAIPVAAQQQRRKWQMPVLSLSARRSAEASVAGRRDTATTVVLASVPAFCRNSHDRPAGSRSQTVRRTHVTSSVAALGPFSMHGLDGTP